MTISSAFRDQWRKAVARCDRIGVELIELHYGHGYLVNQFLSPLVNKRDDDYGGFLENRMRLALEIFDDCRAVWPQDKPMGVKISATDWVDGGWTADNSVALAKALKSHGCDYICASSGGVSGLQKIKTGPGYQVAFADEIRRAAAIATVAVGQIWDPHQAEVILREGRADLIAVGRGMLFDPRWTWHAADALGAFIAYPPRYRTAHPMMRATTTFAESKELREALAQTQARESRQGAATESPPQPKRNSVAKP